MDVGLWTVAKQTIAQALAEALRRDAAQPLVTQIWADGRRAELSARTFENNVAKAANLLQDDLDAEPGTTLLLDVPLHWQVSVWLTAAALTSSRVVVGLDSMPNSTSHIDAAFVDRHHVDGSSDYPAYVVSLHPLGLPEGDIPTGGIDLAREVRAHSDVFVAFSSPDPQAPWLAFADDELTQIQAIDEAITLAEAIGLERGGRLLISGDLTRNSVLALSALPLAYGASIVMCADSDVDQEVIARSEHCTATIRT
jgi:uncharacterized protein (TIGR03089 family)